MMLWTLLRRHRDVPYLRCCSGTAWEEPSIEEITTIGLDIAKSVFQVHAVSATGTVVVRRQLKRRYVVQFFAGLKPCLVGI